MLLNVPKILSPELIKALCEMGHGDKILLADANFPGKSAAERFTLGWLQEDAAENLSLAAKLKADFGLELPEFKVGDDRLHTIRFLFDREY